MTKIRVEMDVHLRPYSALNEKDIEEAIIQGLNDYWVGHIEVVKFTRLSKEVE